MDIGNVQHTKNHKCNQCECGKHHHDDQPLSGKRSFIREPQKPCKRLYLDLNSLIQQRKPKCDEALNGVCSVVHIFEASTVMDRSIKPLASPLIISKELQNFSTFPVIIMANSKEMLTKIVMQTIAKVTWISISQESRK